MKRVTLDGKDWLPRLEVANSMWSRMRGLLGRRTLADDTGLWIVPCNSVHTFFMHFSIDLVFVDKQLCVKKILRDVRPGRMVWPIWGAHSVLELNAGYLDRHPLNVGDKLNVDSALS